LRGHNNKPYVALKSNKYEKTIVQTHGDDVPAPIQRYEDLNLGYILPNIAPMYDALTPIQKHAMPIILEGRDLVALAQTGSGKTQAYLVPLIAKLSANQALVPPNVGGGGKATPEYLILSPTRELAIGIYSQAQTLAHNSNLKIVAIYGGVNIRAQSQELRETGCHILVATPGRLVDMVERGIISLSNIKYLCLDEIDRLLDMGFEPQIRHIEKDLPAPGVRQTLLFSATFPTEIQLLAQDFLSDYIYLRVGTSVQSVTQHVRYVDENDKPAALIDALHESDGLTLVFVDTKRNADALDNYLCTAGLPSTCIHGDRAQQEREAALAMFRSGECPILVCTNVACHGIDLSNVAHVINYCLPTTVDDYVFRSARLCKVGLVTSFFNEKNKDIAKDLAKVLEDSNQEVPEWLKEYIDETDRSRYGQGGRGDRGGRGRASRGRGFGSSTQTSRGQNNNHDNEPNGDQGGNASYGGSTGGSYGGHNQNKGANQDGWW
jgi:ATP-dependent RNA helicase DDX3X